MRRQKNRFQAKLPFQSGEDVNPMNYIGNLSDAMLVLAVGIMLALIMAYNVDIGSPTDESTQQAKTPVQMEDTTELDPSAESLAQSEEADEGRTADDYGLQEYGTVYRDKDGNFYVIEGGQ